MMRIGFPSTRKVHAYSGLMVLVIACNPVSVAAAETDEPKRPRVALVLSGGGARGLAHVGVLQVLEEMKVPVDCVVGPPMHSSLGYDP